MPRKSPTSEMVNFDYIKSNYFRVIHVNGAWGGISPRGEIQVALFSERSSIPQRVSHPFAADGSLEPEIENERIGRDALVREVEALAIMSVETAEALARWLTEQTATFKMVAERGASSTDADADQ